MALYDLHDGGSVTVIGSVTADHPRIIYPPQNPISIAEAPLVGGGFQTAWAIGSNVVIGGGNP